MKLQAYRVARSQPDFPVSREPIWCDLTAGPRALARPGSSSHELYALLQSINRSEPAPHLRARRLPWGFVPHRDTSTESPLANEHPKLALRSALGVSHALDGLLLSLPCGFVSPRSHVRDSPSRGFLPLPSQSASSAPRALLSVSGCRLPPSCLGGASSTRPASRALIRAAIRSHRRGD